MLNQIIEMKSMFNKVSNFLQAAKCNITRQITLETFSTQSYAFAFKDLTPHESATIKVLYHFSVPQTELNPLCFLSSAVPHTHLYTADKDGASMKQ